MIFVSSYPTLDITRREALAADCWPRPQRF